MDLLATSSIPSSFPPVVFSSKASLLQTTVGSLHRGRMKLTWGFFHERQGHMVPSKSRSFGFLRQIERRNQIANTSQLKFGSVICGAASNARCSAEQTQTVTREAPTITHLPGKEKSPELDDGGSGFPPRDDGDGGGGGGGGGGNWSGGFFFFGFLAFLGFLKDKESEGSYRDERRR